MARDEQLLNAEQWRKGVPFSEAWFAYGDSRSIELFRKARNRGAIKARLMLMVADLWARLNSGELLAFGHRVSPTISDGPVLIPTDTFFDRPPPGVEYSDDIEISGWRYERVKVRERDAVNDAGETDESAAPAAAETGTVSPAPKRGGGRPSMYEKATIVFKELLKQAAYATMPADKLHPAFVSEFAMQFPVAKYKVQPPSARALRNYLKRYRQELAETGNNKPAD